MVGQLCGVGGMLWVCMCFGNSIVLFFHDILGVALSPNVYMCVPSFNCSVIVRCRLHLMLLFSLKLIAVIYSPWYQDRLCVAGRTVGLRGFMAIYSSLYDNFPIYISDVFST